MSWNYFCIWVKDMHFPLQNYQNILSWEANKIALNNGIFENLLHRSLVQVKCSLDVPLAILQLFWYTVVRLSWGVNIYPADMIFPICASHYVMKLFLHLSSHYKIIIFQLPIIFKISCHGKPTKLLSTNGGNFVNLWESSSQIFGTGQMPPGYSLALLYYFSICPC